MTDHEYTPDEIRTAYDMMQAAARIASMVDLGAARAVLESMHFVDSVMPITDPTGWMTLRETAPAHQQFAQAFVNFRTVLEEFRPGRGARMNNELAVYQRAVELAKAQIATHESEIRRLETELATVRANLGQMRDSRDAERAARRAAEADNIQLVESARALARTAARQVIGYDDQVVLILRMALNDLNRVVNQPHPGAALLTELDAARAFIATARELGIDWNASEEERVRWLRDAHAYDEAVKATKA